MTADERPYIESCSFCGDGLIRFYRCQSCDAIVALCDECELMWQDIETLSVDPNLPADTTFPCCPACGSDSTEWTQPTPAEIEEQDLRRFCLGDSI